MTKLARLRRFWLDVHLWIGAGLLVALAPLGVTGSLLVWHDGLDRALYAERYAVSGPQTAQPLGAYAAAAQQAFGDRALLSQLRMPEQAGDPVVAVGRMPGPATPGRPPRTLNAWIDPPTARVLATTEIGRTFTMIVHRLHGSLMIPDVGRKIVGWLGWAMFVSSATGLWLWWPRHGGLVQGLRWRRGASQLFNLHHTLGFWICLPLAILSLTGVYISFPQTSHALLGAPPPPARGGPGRNAPPLDHPRLSVAEAVAAARTQAADARLLGLRTPAKGREPAWQVEFKGPRGRLTVNVTDATGQVRAGGREGGQAPDPLSRWMRSVHDGTDMGPIWQGVIFAAGLAPAILGLTGVVMWLRQRRRRRALRQATSAA